MYSCLCVILNFCGISLMKSRFVSSSSQIKQFIFKSGTSYFIFIYYLFYCCSSTIVSIFTPPTPTSYPQSLSHFGFVQMSFIHVPWWPFPYFPWLFLSLLPSCYCQFVLYFIFKNWVRNRWRCILILRIPVEKMEFNKMLILIYFQILLVTFFDHFKPSFEDTNILKSF